MIQTSSPSLAKILRTHTIRDERLVLGCGAGLTFEIKRSSQREGKPPMSRLFQTPFRSLLAIICAVAIFPGETLAYPSPPLQQAATPSSTAQAAKIPAEQLDSLVAPIALYPDPLLAQILAASTYPLEVVQLQQWLAKNKDLKDKQLADAVAKQSWDPSIQALAALPDVVKLLGDNIQWTTDLGNASLSQQSDVMDAVQRMRKKAQEKGNLRSTEQQTVETKVIEQKSVIVIEQANPQVVYVPSYDPVVVYGPAYYPYPPIYYPPWGYYAAGMAFSFGVGVMMGAFWSGGWGWGCGWGGNNITINNNNNFNRNNIGNRPANPIAGGGNRGNIGGGRPSQLPAGAAGGNNWRHNPEHRGGAPYRDRATADRFGGTTRGDSLSKRQAGARQAISRQGGNLASNRGGAGVGNRGGNAGVSNRMAGTGSRGSSPSFSNRSAGGADSIGSRDLSRSGGGSRDAFGGGSRGYNGASARSNGSRGASSMGARGGGGGFRGGGGGGRRR